MYEEKIEIIIKTNNRLTDDEIYEIILNFKSRLEGYTTTSPESLMGSKLNIKYAGER